MSTRNRRATSRQTDAPAAPAPATPLVDRRSRARLCLKPGLKAAILVEKACSNTKTLIDPTMYKDDPTTEVDFSLALGEHIRAAVQDGDLKGLEEMLVAQAFSLDALYFRLANLAIHQTERPNLLALTGLAIRAQGACRATIETLATIKNPPTLAFVRQANIAGVQQVNNGETVTSRAGDVENAQNKLMEVPPHEVKRLDAGAPATHALDDSPVETLEVLDRPQDRRREGQGFEERLQGGSAAEPAPARSRGPRHARRGALAEQPGEAVPPVAHRDRGRNRNGS